MSSLSETPGQAHAFALDLAFTAAPDALVRVPLNTEAHQRLKSAAVWESTLELWLGHLINLDDHTAPMQLRNCQEICLGLQFVDDAEIADLNQRWRGQPNPTDVLSFSALEADMPSEGTTSLELGDIIVAVPTAAQQALDQNHGLDRELCWLVSHGLLHLLGWDHPDEPSLMAMLQCQEQLLAMAGKVQSHGEIDCESADEITAGP